MISRIRPGRALITATRWPRNTASSMSWVMKTTVVPVRFQIARSSSCRRSRVCASRAPNGSSMSSTSGSYDRLRAIATRCFMPPDSSCG